MNGKLASEIENEINRKGFHILRKKFAKNDMYPNQFHEYKEIGNIQKGKKYAIRLFVKHTQNGIERIDGGMIDVQIKSIKSKIYSGEILTLLPPNFPLKTGTCIDLIKDEILYAQE